MVKVMPTEKSLIDRQRTHPTRIVALGALVLLGAARSVLAQSPEAPASDDWLSSIFSTYGITIALILFLVGLFVFKKLRVRKQKAAAIPANRNFASSQVERKQLSPARPRVDETASDDQHAGPTNAIAVAEKAPLVDFEQSAYGAYRIDQEVGKLVLGKPHRMDVMASRISDDRRAIEASLVKALESAENGADGRRRALQALEEYGFVARQSATLLLGRDAWERSSAARTLGQVGSQSSLPFLIEALHDADSVVRNQAVSSLGALKMPAAIGALLDIARRHSDIPAALLSETLSACSVESLGFLDLPSSEPAALTDGSTHQPDFELFGTFEDLPAGNEDEELSSMIEKLADEDTRVRSQTATELGTHHAQRSVSALTSMALNDPDPAARASAVSSLGSIDHESVFAPVVISLADESREVRAAAARTLSGLHFDRADAYVRLMETADAELLKSVADACVKTGIVGQAVDRLASEDRRQAYEAFSLFSLLAKAHETQPIIDAIARHEDQEVRLCAVRVLNVAAQSEVAPQLRELVGRDDLPEAVRTAILEVLYKIEPEPVSERDDTDVFEREVFER
jgi:HEAT repeat protein